MGGGGAGRTSDKGRPECCWRHRNRKYHHRFWRTAALPSESAAEKQHLGSASDNPLYDCSMADEDKTIPGTGEDFTQNIAGAGRQKHGDCRLECYASERRKYQTEDAKTEKELIRNRLSMTDINSGEI